jgi:hypothetical protein
MDWSKVKTAIGTIAPWLAGTLGSPVAGVAVQALCGVFGLAGDSANPDTIAQAIAAATPQQLQDLKAAELKHAEVMQGLGYTHIEQLEQIAEADRDSARKREAAVKDNTPAALAALAVVGFIGLVVMVCAGFEPKQSMQAGFWMLAGAEIAILKDVYGYYFGSSASSKGKDDTIAAQAGVSK